MNCGFNIVYGYTQSDEISLLFHRDDNTFGRNTRKINSILAGEASGRMSLALSKLAVFDCRVVPLPNLDRVKDYFLWRQEDAHRNSLNSHCYWILRSEGMSKQEATYALCGKSTSVKNELLFQRGINFNNLPLWQKRGVGVYFKDIYVDGFNPVANSCVRTKRRRLFVDYELPLKEEYGLFLEKLIEVK
jgi:tRNA(His) 5'-end guanylyltransferase